MKPVTDNAFSKAWKKDCPTCTKNAPNLKLWFRDKCHECEMQQLEAAKKLIKNAKTSN